MPDAFSLLTARALPTTPPATWDLRAAKQAVAFAAQGAGAAPLGDEEYAANEAIVEQHDHWRDGKGWIGPDGGAPEMRAKQLARIERQFTPVDVIGEVLDRLTNALLKRRPTIDFVPRDLPADGQLTTTEQTEVAQLREAIGVWMRRVQFGRHARAAVRRSRWSTRGLLRVWIPAAHLVETPAGDAGASTGDAGTAPTQTLPSNLTLAHALERVALSAPPPNTAAVLIDEATQERIGVVLFRDAAGKEAAEIWRVVQTAPNGGDGAGAARETECRVLRGGKEETTRLPLAGRLPVTELQAELLITEPVRRQQARLNFVETNLNRVVETAGFRERHVINAAPHGFWTDRPIAGEVAVATKVEEGKVLYCYSQPRTIGSSVTTELQGIPYDVDETGRKALTTPTVIFAEPADPQFVVTGAEHARATILRSCKQGHVLGADATQSGISREEARAEFEDDVTNLQEPTEMLLRETLEAALALANPMLAPSEPLRGALDRYRLTVGLYVDTGPRAADQHLADAADVAAGRLALRTAMQRDGIQDPDAEMKRIADDPVQRAARSQVQALAVAAWTTAGAGLGAAADLAGLTEEEQQTLVTNGGQTPGLDGIVP